MALGTARAKRLATIDFVRPHDLESPEYRRDAENGTYDLIIYDQCAAAQMPRANTLFIGRLPPGNSLATARRRKRRDRCGARNQFESTVAGPQIIDWDRASPLLANVDLGDVAIADSLLVRPPAGGSVLTESTAGPIAAIAPRDSYQDAVLGFEIVGLDADGTRTANTNWPIRPSFPTFWLNVLEYLATRGEQQESAAARPGQTVNLQAPAAAEQLIVVARIDGRRSCPDPSRTPSHLRTQIRRESTRSATASVVIERFAVNLFDRAESDIAVRPTQDPESSTLRPADIRIGHVDIAATTDRAPARQEAWKIVLACALFVLLLEWYIYNRRVYL